MTSTYSHFLNGQAVASDSDQHSDVFNPATGEVIAQVPMATQAELAQAVAHAKDAAAVWGDMPSARRARVMFKLLELLNANIDRMAEVVTREHGKTFDDAKGEVMRGIEIVEFATGIPVHQNGQFSDNVASGVDQYQLRLPLGVTAGITPFNFPIMIPLWMSAMSLACGNAFILKPSERDPGVGMILAELMTEAGVPAGAFQVLHGDKSAVDGLLEHPEVKAISFVGSTPIAKYIYSRGAELGKRVQALGGAKNHMIIMPDADMDKAADALMGAGYGAAGERCMAISVAVPVGEGTANTLVEALAPRVRDLKIGNGMDAGVEMGPLINAAAHERITGLINSGIQAGAELVVDGREFKPAGLENGFFMGGTLFDKVTTEMEIYRQEIFGPVLSVVRSESFEHATQLATDHEFGNGTAIFTRDGGIARRFAREVEVGMVGINVPIPVPTAWSSFGGWKASLFGDTHMYGPEGVKFWTRQKNVMTRWPDTSLDKLTGAFNFGAAAG